ncbi:MAG: hypothetical protein WBG90_08180 [Saonia sp.]
MNLRILVVLLSFIGILSCNTSKKETSPIALAEQYYRAMNTSDFTIVTGLFLDSIRMKENDYSAVFSKEDYIHWLQWDSVFKPAYKILKISEKDGKVNLHISKECRRTLFLNEEPVINNELMVFKDNRIVSIEIDNYIVFNDSLFSQKRAKLLTWIDENHAELNGFIHDQTKAGALNYIKALDLYEARE